MARAAVVSIPITPGALSDDTDLAAQLHAVDMDKVRYRGNRAETIHGWSQFNASGMSSGTARGCHAWATLTGAPVLLAASESAVNAWVAGTRSDITPKTLDMFVPSTSVIFSTNVISISPWKLYDPTTGTSVAGNCPLLVGDVVTFSGVPFSGGGYNPNGSFTVSQVAPSGVILTASGAFPTVRTIDAYTITVPFRNGLATGTGDLVSQKARIYSISNFGEDAVFCGSDGTPIWFWQPATSYPELTTNGTFTGSMTGWTTTAGGWAYGANNVVFTGGGAASTLIQDLNSKMTLTAGKVYEMSFTIVAIGATFTLDIQAYDSTYTPIVKIHPSIVTGAVGAADYQRTYTFRFVCPADTVYIGFTANSANNLTLDNVSIKLLSTAAPISQAPQVNRALFVDANHILTALATVQADGTFNPLLMRWSAQDNYRSWIPSTTNIAGELSLGVGSTAVCGLPAGGQNLIFTDDAVFISTFTSTGYTLTLAGQGSGPLGARAAATVNNVAFWASTKGIFMFDGARVLPIEMPIKDRFVNQLRQYQENKTFVWISVEFGEVWIHYPHTSDGTEVSRYLIYNFAGGGNPWSFGTFNRTCWIRSGVFSYPIAFDTSGAVWYQETGNTMSGSITLPYLETGYATGQDGDRWIGCRRYYPDIENQTGNMLVMIKGKLKPQGLNNTDQVGPFVMEPNRDKLDFLIRSRQLKLRWASQASPTYWRLGVVGLEMVSNRERR